VVALAVAVGVYAVGVVLSTREVLLREWNSDQAGARAAAAIIHTYPFDDELAGRIADLPEVAAAEGRSVARTHVYGESGERLELILVAIPDFEEIDVDAVSLIAGKRAPGKREVVLERNAVEYLDTALGATLSVELEGEVDKRLSVVGTAHDPQQLSPSISERTYGYVTPETMGALGLGEDYTELRLRVMGERSDRGYVQTVVDGVQDHLERSGREVLTSEITTRSDVMPIIDAIVLILSTFGLVILLLSGFLVVNAISALVAQQVPQIGVMKLVGARRSQIITLYIVTVLVYGLIAGAVGIPMAMLTSRFLMTELVEPLMNVVPESYSVPLYALLIQVAVGLLLPLLAGLPPVLRGTRLTTHKALNDVGAQVGGSGRGWMEGLLATLQKLKRVQRPVLLAVRNTMRHRGRLAQTLLVLTVGTALFISVLSVRSSVDATLEGFMRFHQYDVSVGLERPYRTARIEQVARGVPGVVGVESWSTDRAIRLRSDGSESDGMRVFAVPLDTTMMAPVISAGNWLSGRAPQEIVVNSDVLEEEPDLEVGGQMVLDMGGREGAWQIVGTVPTESRGPMVYMNHDDYAHFVRDPDKATQAVVVAERHDADFQHELETRLYARFEAQGLEVRGTETTQSINSSNKLMFTVVVAILILMALLLAAVGGLGLTTTMSINVLERIREIGVLRAIGASNQSVRSIVLAEGVVMGILSWGIGALISVPISSLMSEQVGLLLIDVPLSYQYSIWALVVWFFALIAVAVAASLGPARNAVRLTIREVLAYE
jgi:putative ABC transport system permease protein